MISKNTLRSLVSRALGSSVRRSGKRLTRRNSGVEQLESRALLATFTVTSVEDGGPGSLNAAIVAANNGAGPDVIEFDSAINQQELDLAEGQLTITGDLTIQGNGAHNTIIDAQQLSRIFNVTGGSLTLNDITLKNGRPSVGGGGAILMGNGIPLTINRSVLSGNVIPDDSDGGGAILANNATVRINDSTLSNNSTFGVNSDGGAIMMFGGDGVLLVNQSTFSGNSTNANSSGGGAIFGSFGLIHVNQSTLTNNSSGASPGGAIYSRSASITITNSIVAGNSGSSFGVDIRKSNDSGDVLTVNNSLIGRNNGTGLSATSGNTPDVNGNLVGGASNGTEFNPQLGILQKNGGTTPTHQLLAASPAVNRGNSGFAVNITQSGNPVLSFDQRGAPIPRFFGFVDMGATELISLSGDLIVTTASDEVNGDIGSEDLSLREAVTLANAIPGPNIVRFGFATNEATVSLASGQMEISESLTITGRGINGTQVDAQQASRLFQHTGGNLTINSITLKNGRTTADGTTGSGGAIQSNSGGSLNISDSVITGNSTTGANAIGGGIFVNSGAVTLVNSTVSGNSTSGNDSNGGGISTNSGAMTLIRSTVSGNSTSGNSADGGGISTNSGAMTLINSTVSGNQVNGTDSDGGGIRFDDSFATIVNSTVTANSASRAGGGIGMFVDSFDRKLTIHNSIIAGNIAGSNPEFTAPTNPGNNLEVRNSLIGRNNGTSLTATVANAPDSNGNLVGGNSDLLKVDPLLGPLRPNGGVTSSHALLAGSPAIDRGAVNRAVDVSNSNTPLTIDQRGGEFVRIANSLPDMGSYERQTLNDLQLIVTLNSDEYDGNFSAEDLSLREAVELANGSVGSNSISFDENTDLLTIALTQGEIFVGDTLIVNGNGVTNTIIDAQQLSRIFNFQIGDLTLNAVTLRNGRTTAVNANGGAIFSSSTGLLTIQNSTLSGNSTTGASSGGGAIAISSGTLSVIRSTLSGNSTASNAGGGAIYANNGDVSVSESTLSENATSGGAASGGAVYLGNGLLSVSRSTLFENNARGANGRGGAIATSFGTVIVSQSTFSENDARGTNGLGGAIFSQEGPVLISQSTLTLNNVLNGGGAIFSESASLTILNSIVAGNTDTSSIATDVRKSPNGDDVFTVTNSLIGRSNGTNLTASANPDSSGNLIGGITAGAGINPLLAPLANNGGPTLTHALQSLSPAFNRGSNALAVDVTLPGSPALTTDQRGTGFVRTAFGIVDMGAVETRTLDGTTGADAFTLTYSSTATSGTVTVTVSTNGGPVVNRGTFPMNVPFRLNGLGGTDSVRVVGTIGSDTFSVASTSLTVNGSTLILTSIENRTLAGGALNDNYRFDADAALGLYTLDESGGGTDTIDLSLTTTVGLSLNLGIASTQVVHPTNLSLNLSSSSTFENIAGGSLNDTLVGNALANLLNGNAGSDTLTGAGGSDTLLGGLGDDSYIFATATAAEADTLTEGAGGGVDTISFATITTPVTFSLGTGAVQSVHTNRTVRLNSTIQFESAAGGSSNDVLTGNTVANLLNANAGSDTLNGAGGSDTLLGGLGDDTYVFSPATAAEADTLTEGAGGGVDTISFAAITTPVTFSLGTGAVQSVHTNRTVRLNSTIQFENAAGGSGADTLNGNTVANILIGNAGGDTLNGLGGRDILIGGLGLDRLNGGDDEDILIAGRTASDALFSSLNRMQLEWTSGNSYATRITNLRAGVGSPAVSLKAKVNVRNDAGEDDSLIGGNNPDWYFRALDDVITGLVAGEVLDVL